MKKHSFLTAAVSIMMIGATGTCLAAASPFSDVPQDHWAREAVSRLAADGVLQGYGDATFRGDKNITRYEMAQMVAKAMTHRDSASTSDKADIDHLQAEFADELNSLGVRVANIERNQDNVKWNGCYAQKYMEQLHNGRNGNVRGNAYWEKSFDLDVNAKVPKSGFSVSAVVNTKMGGKKFNDEAVGTEDYNGGYSRSNSSRLDKVFVEGALGKTGQQLKFGLFQPWVQNGAISDATIKGAQFDHYGKNYATHLIGGRLDIKDWDSAVSGSIDGADTKVTEGWRDNSGLASDAYVKNYTAASYNIWGDFVRKTSGRTFKTETQPATGSWTCDWSKSPTTTYSTKGSDYGSDNDYDPQNYKFLPHTKTLYAFIYDRTFSKAFSGSIGYYHYKSAAYDEDALQVEALSFDYKIKRNLNLNAVYGHGNQGGHDDMWSAEFQYRPSHRLYTYLGYRYLGPDAIVKTNYGDGIGAGQRGWEMGMTYDLARNIQYTMKYGTGHSITYNNMKRTKIYTCLSFNF
ncbi:MAG: S-layer homology domain-containing protein [Selenomonas sp.]|jgi:hypothetical protein|nr:S-layer homology domain-containing protein [Selenomonas sp.]